MPGRFATMYSMALTALEFNCYQATLGASKVAPEKVALWHLPDKKNIDQAVTYGELRAEIHRVAFSLRQKGIGYGDKVLVLLPMSPALYSVMFAVAMVGASSVLVDPVGGAARLMAALGDAKPRAVFIPTGVARFFRLLPGVRDVPCVFFVNIDQSLFPGVPEDREICAVSPDDAISLVYTTGSTGAPKPVRRSHSDMLAMLAALNQHPAKHSEAVDLPMWPNLVFDALCHGRTCVIPAATSGRLALSSPDVLIGQMERCGVTMWIGPPGPLEKLLDEFEAHGSPRALQHIFVGGALVPPRVLRRAQNCLPLEGEAVAVYGSTEADPVATLSARDLVETPARMGVPIGRLHPNIRLRLVQPDVEASEWSGARDVVPGEVGEIWVTGPHVNTFLEPSDPGGHSTKMVDPTGVVWHRMGDLAWQDNQQCLFLMGRWAQRVQLAERVLDTIPVELTALEVAGVKRAALLGRNMEAWVVVEPTPHARLHEVQEALIRALEPFSVTRVVFHPQMPLDARHMSRIDLQSLTLDLPDDPPRLPPLASPPPFLEALRLYLRERFPLLQTLIGVLLMVATDGLATLALIDQPLHREVLPQMMIVVAIFIGVFFHLRVFDEHKDWAVDRVAFPERILSRGWVTLRQLRFLAAGVIVSEILLAATTSLVLLGWTLVLIAYSWLMLREFYVGDWLKRHLVMYGASHMAIISLMSLAAYGAILDALPWSVVSHLSGAQGFDATLHGVLPALASRVWHPGLLLFAGMNFCLIYSLEVARKIRTPELERPQVDTYSRRLGIPGALVLVLATQCSGLAMLALASSALHVPWGVFLWGGLTIAFVAVRYGMFYLNPTPAASKRLEATGALTLVNLNVALILFWGVFR